METTGGNIILLLSCEEGINLTVLDNSGSLLWSNTYDATYDMTFGFNVGADIELIPNGDILVCGDHAGMLPFLLRLDGNGNIIWGKVYPEFASGAACVNMTLASNGNVLVTGLLDGTDGFLMSVDQQGVTQWMRRYPWWMAPWWYEVATLPNDDILLVFSRGDLLVRTDDQGDVVSAWITTDTTYSRMEHLLGVQGTHVHLGGSIGREQGTNQGTVSRTAMSDLTDCLYTSYPMTSVLEPAYAGLSGVNGVTMVPQPVTAVSVPFTLVEEIWTSTPDCPVGQIAGPVPGREAAMVASSVAQGVPITLVPPHALPMTYHVIAHNGSVVLTGAGRGPNPTIPTTGLSTGLYTVVVTDEQGFVAERVLVY